MYDYMKAYEVKNLLDGYITKMFLTKDINEIEKIVNEALSNVRKLYKIHVKRIEGNVNGI